MHCFGASMITENQANSIELDSAINLLKWCHTNYVNKRLCSTDQLLKYHYITCNIVTFTCIYYTTSNSCGICSILYTCCELRETPYMVYNLLTPAVLGTIGPYVSKLRPLRLSPYKIKSPIIGLIKSCTDEHVLHIYYKWWGDHENGIC